MKICWDNLEGMYLSRNGNFKKGRALYVYKESCAKCGKPYLAEKYRLSTFCGHSCANKDKKFSDEHKQKLSKARKTRICSVETKKRLSKSRQYRVGSLSPCYKGGVTKAGSLSYETGKNKLGPYEEVRKQKDTEVLEVKCAYCGSWFAPKRYQVRNRLAAINNLGKGEQRLYCSENCKRACPIYGKVKYPKGFKHVTSREVNPYLRQMCFERDNWECQICGKTTEEIQLHCHHMDPVAQNPMFQNDVDSCITLCKDCHKKVHKQHGCRYVDLQCKKK